MKTNKLRRYTITVLGSTLIVIAFAAIQYELIQKIPFTAHNYLIPILVGLTFGFLISHIKTLENKYHLEKDLVSKKNSKIHTYIGTIVHDLRSPISAVYSILELLETQEDFKNKKSKNLLHISKTSIESMLENIQLILDNTKLESGKLLTQLEEGNPYYTINSTIDKHLILAINKSISLFSV